MKQSTAANHLLLHFTILISVLFATACSGSKDSQLITAAFNGDLAAVKDSLRNASSIDAKANDGWTALSVAAREGHYDVVVFLLGKGADINALEDGGNSALFWAAFSGNIKIVNLLLQKGADIGKKCAKCQTPLEIAKSKGFDNIVAILQKYSN